MKSTGTAITPTNIRRRMVIFSLSLDIFLKSKESGARSQEPGESGKQFSCLTNFLIL
jgi:hypothetical protein